MLQPNDQFPSITITPPEGAPLELPDALGRGFGVVLFFRGAWCPYCNAQLRAFQRAQDKLSELDTKVVALSVDDEATTRELVEKHGLTFPVGHSADARAVASGIRRSCASTATTRMAVSVSSTSWCTRMATSCT